MNMRTDKEPGAFSGYESNYINSDYVISLLGVDAVPICFPIVNDDYICEKYISSIDGLIVTGGYDVSPRFYNEEPMQKLGEVCEKRDLFEMALIKEAIKQGKPVLGICRGFQLLNVYKGGSLYQDLSYSDKELIKHWQNQTPELPTHTVNVEKGNFFSDILDEKQWVNSFHHQVLKDIGEGFTVCATASDGVVEAIENKEEKLIGVQFHPEMTSRTLENMKKIFEKFVSMC